MPHLREGGGTFPWCVLGRKDDTSIITCRLRSCNKGFVGCLAPRSVSARWGFLHGRRPVLPALRPRTQADPLVPLNGRCQGPSTVGFGFPNKSEKGFLTFPGAQGEGVLAGHPLNGFCWERETGSKHNHSPLHPEEPFNRRTISDLAILTQPFKMESESPRFPEGTGPEVIRFGCLGRTLGVLDACVSSRQWRFAQDFGPFQWQCVSMCQASNGQPQLAFRDSQTHDLVWETSKHLRNTVILCHATGCPRCPCSFSGEGFTENSSMRRGRPFLSMITAGWEVSGIELTCDTTVNHLCVYIYRSFVGIWINELGPQGKPLVSRSKH